MRAAALAEDLSRSMNRNGQPWMVFRELSFHIARGELVHVIGPSGCGKSSLLRLMNRLDEPSGGRLEVLGRTVREWNVYELRKRVGMVFQEPVLLEFTVRENLTLPARLNGEAPPTEARMRRTLDLVGLEAGFLKRTKEELSGGEKRRVALARALVRRPEILLLDEPTNGLDMPLARRLLDTLQKLRKREGLTIIMATHRLEEVRYAGGRVLVLASGRLIEDAPAERLFEESASAETRRFLREAGYETSPTAEAKGERDSA